MPALLTSSLVMIFIDYLLRIIITSTSCLNIFGYICKFFFILLQKESKIAKRMSSYCYLKYAFCLESINEHEF